MKKKLLFTIISLIVVIGTVIGLIVPSFSAPEDIYDEELNNINEPVRAGAVGEIYWKVTNNVLYLRNDATSGYAKVNETNINAATTDNYTTNIPWGSSAGTITKVVIENEIRPTTTRYYFSNMSKLATIENIKNLNTSNVTNMVYMFYGCSNLTQLDLSNINTSKATDMGYMFNGCSKLTTLDLSKFDTSQVTDMYAMFDGCSNLTQLDLRSFDTSKVTYMYSMFSGCSNLTQLDLSNFDTSKVTNMSHMFSRCSNLTQLDLKSFNTSKVTNMYAMFSECSNLTQLDLSNINTSKVTDMGYMFSRCSNLTQLDLSKFDTSQVTYMVYMFYKCSNLTQLDLSIFNTSKVTNMSYMFGSCSSLTTLNVSSFNTSKVTDMRFMFYGCSNLTQLDLSKFDTSNVTDMRYMFNGCSKLTTLDLSSFNTSNVTTMRDMFHGCSKLTTLNVSRFNTSKVEYMGDMFNGCSKLQTLNLSSFNVSKVTDMTGMYNGCKFTTLYTPKTGTKTEALPYTMYDTAGASYTQSTINRVLYKINPTIGRVYWKVASGVLYLRNDSTSGYAKVNETNINAATTANYTTNVPWGSSAGTITKVVVENKIQPTKLNLYFYNMSKLTTIENIANLNTSNVTNMGYMFANSGFITLNVSSFDVSKVTTMTGMYNGCKFTTLYTPKTGTKTETLPYTMYDTAGTSYTQSTINRVLYKIDPTIGRVYWKVASGVLYLRNDAQSGYAKVDEAKVNTAVGSNYTTTIPWGSSAGTITKVVIENEIRPTTTRSYFIYMQKLTTIENLSKLNTTNVTNMYGMFFRCDSIAKLDLRSFNTSKVTNMSYMFGGCANLDTLDVSSFDTSKVTDMSYMFLSLGKLATLNISNFNVSKVTTMTGMYNGCKVTTLYTPKTGTKTEALPYTMYDTAGVSYTQSTINKILYKIDPTIGRVYWKVASGVLYLRNDAQTGYAKVDETLVNKATSSNYTTNIPWGSSAGTITKVVIENEIKPTTLRLYFYVMSQLTEIQNIANLNTSNVTIMNSMFNGCSKLQTLDLSNFNTSKVTTMNRMFNICSSLTKLDVSSFDVSKVTDMIEMYRGCQFNELHTPKTGTKTEALPYTMYDTAGVSYTQSTINRVLYKINPTTGRIYWKVANNVLYLRNDAQSGYAKVDEAKVNAADEYNYTTNIPWGSSAGTITKVVIENEIRPTNTNYYFYDMAKLATIENIANLNTSNVTDMGYMFYNCSNLTQLDLRSFDTSQVTDMGYMFTSCRSLTKLDLRSFNTRNVTSMYAMFYECRNLTQLDLSNFDTSNVTSMAWMFYGCSKLTTLNISSFNTSQVTDMRGMFYECSNLTQLDLRSFNTSNVTLMGHMFSGCINLTQLDLSKFDTSQVTNMSAMFSGCSNLTQLDLRSFNVSKVTDMTGMYNGCRFTILYTPKTGTATTETDLPYTMYDASYNRYSESTIDRVLYKELGVYWKVESGVLYLRNNAQSGYAKVDEAKVNTADISNYTTTIPWANYSGTITKVVIENNIKPTTTKYYFHNMNKLLSIDNIENLDTRNVTAMTSMFSGCSSLQTLDVSGFDTSNVTTMASMFYGCTSIQKLDVSSFTTSKVTTMAHMFYKCTGLQTLDVNGFDTSNVTNMYAMFYQCSKLQTINLSNLNTSKVTNMGYMFNGCSNLKTLNISNFDLSKITDYENIRHFLDGCYSLESINTHKVGRVDIPLGHVMKDSANKLYIHMPINKTITTKRLDLSSSDYTGIGEVNSVKYGNVENLTYNINSVITNSSKYSNKIEVSPFADGNNLWIKIRNTITLGYPYDSNNIYTYAKSLGVEDSVMNSTMKNATQIALDYYINHYVFPQETNEIKIAKKIVEEVDKKNTIINNEIGVYVALPNDKTKQNKIVLNSSVNPIVVSKIDNNFTRVIGARLRIVNKDGNVVTGGSINGSSVNDVLFESSNINTLVNLPLGEYILKEVYTPTGYKRASDISFSVTSSNINTGQYITMIDTKTNETTRDLKISNKLEGKYAEYDREFRISININTQETRNLNATIYRKNNTEENVVIKTKEESIFTLAHDEYIIIKEVPQGVSYSVVQLEDTGYVVTYKEGSTSNIINSNIYNGRVMDYSDINELEITNTRQVSIETGIVVSIIPFITLLLIATAMFILYKKSYIGVNNAL